MLAEPYLGRLLRSPFGLAYTVAPKQSADVLPAIASFPLFLVLTGVVQGRQRYSLGLFHQRLGQLNL